MKVSELIDALKKVDQDIEVLMSDSKNYGSLIPGVFIETSIKGHEEWCVVADEDTRIDQWCRKIS